MSDLSTFDQIKSLSERRIVDASVCDLELRAKMPTAKQWAEVRALLIASQRDSSKAAECIAQSELMTLHWLCDEQGREMFTEDQIAELGDGNAALVAKVSESILNATGLGDDDLLTTAKNSGATSGGDSPTS